MNRLIAALGVISALSMAGCMAAGPDEELSADALRNGKACTHTGMCGDEEYCSVEDGDCFSNCRPGQNCPAVCWGLCKPKDVEYCYSSANCDDGEYCSVEDGDCFSNCPPGMVCPAVCSGICKPAATPEPEPRKACYGSHNCGEGEHCSVEDGDCFSNCPPGMVCPAVCSGFCVPNATAIRAEPAPGDGEIGDRERGCYSSENCGKGEYCTVEDGDCDSDCAPGMICPAVCKGVCAPIVDDGGEACGGTTCGAGMVCCNPSCGICTPPGWSCTQQVCDDVI